MKSFKDTVDLISDYAIFTLDPNGTITSWNKGAEIITGWKKDEVVGRSYDFLYPGDQIKESKPMYNLQQTLKNGRQEEEGLRIRKDGYIYISDVITNPIYSGKEKKHLGFIQVIRDITNKKREELERNDDNALLKREIERRKKIEADLQYSNGELDAFAGAASHDLQEPLRMVVSYLQLIERRYGDKFDKDGVEFLNFAVDGATRMKTLISDLVEYSRVPTLGKPLKKTDPSSSLKRAINNLRVAVEETDAKITYDRMPIVVSDEVQLTQVFQNLLSNAIKFRGKAKPKIHIGVELTKDETIFFIKDNGIGINMHDQQLIFNIFKQLGKRSERKGSGIGLSIAKKIITRNNGRMWVASEPGKGSTFFFSIPKLNKKEGNE